MFGFNAEASSAEKSFAPLLHELVRFSSCELIDSESVGLSG